MYICATYAVQSCGPAYKKALFWRELNSSTSIFQEKPGHRILVGDFNARLGTITGDHDINSNKELLLSFVDDHGLINMNVLRSFGEYTFHNISNGSRSIIDYLLTDLESYKIPEHTVLTGSIGTSAQTAHKAILSKILIDAKITPLNKRFAKPKWRSVNEKNWVKFNNSLKLQLAILPRNSCDYKCLLAAINRAKTNSIGRMHPRPSSATNPNPEIDALVKELGVALKVYENQPNDHNLQHSMSLEKQIRSARIKHQRKTLIQFLDKLESKHQVSKMRAFYHAVKKKTTPPTDPTFVIWNPDSPEKNPNFSSTKEEYLEYWARYLEKIFHCTSTSTFNQQSIDQSTNTQNQPLTNDELERAIKGLKNLKAAGIDEITNEDIKIVESLKPGLVLNILQRIWIKEICPDNFRKAITHLFPKPK